jgi:hypothetical protein
MRFELNKRKMHVGLSKGECASRTSKANAHRIQQGQMHVGLNNGKCTSRSTKANARAAKANARRAQQR